MSVWNDLAAARAAAAGIEANRQQQLEQLAAVEAQLEQLALALASLPAQVTAATTARDQAAAASRQAQSALASAQGPANTASAAVTADRNALAAAQTADQQAKDELQALQDRLEELLNTRLPFKPVPPAGAIAALRRQIVAQAQAVKAADAAVTAAQNKVNADQQQANTANAAVTQAQQVLNVANQKLSAAQQLLNQRQGLLDQAKADQPTFTAKAAQLRTAAKAAEGQAAQAWQQFDRLLAQWLSEVAAAREAMRAARTAAVGARHQLELAQVAERNAGRQGKQSDGAATAAAQAVQHADQAAAQARGQLDAVRAELLGDPDVQSLISAVPTDTPLLLFPVRLETAFLDNPQGGTDLAVRIYPDSVQIDGHEPALSDSERAWATAAMQAIAGDDETAARAAWDNLVSTLGAYRAAWALRALNDGNPQSRPTGWRPPPSIRLLPDRWFVLGYLGGKRVLTASSQPVPDDLVVLPGVSGPSGLTDVQTRWATDLQAAIDTGMAVRVPLPPELAGGLDTVVVVGVRATADATSTATDTATLLESHRYSDGLSLPEVGAATNATSADDGNAAAASLAEAGRPAYALEFGEPLAKPGDGSVADLATTALGLPAPANGAGALDRVTGAAGRGAEDASRMAAALWPATWGYFFDQMLTGVLSDSARELARRHFIDHVRGRGPLPLVQLARQPYGLLPVTSLDHYVADATDPVGAAVGPVLKALRDQVWRPAVTNVPRLDPAAVVGRPSSDISGPLASVLGQQADSVAISVRRVLGGEYAWNLWNFLSQTPVDPAVWQSQTARARGLATLLALPQPGRVAGAAFFADVQALDVPLVAPTAGSTGAAAQPAAYLQWLLTSGWQALRDKTGTTADSVLFLLLRHAALRSYADAAAVLLGLVAEQRLEPELVAIDGSAETVWDRLAQALPTGQLVGDYLDALRRDGAHDTSLPAVPEFTEFWAAVSGLAVLPEGALAALLVETIDVCSHRLDAWVTSLADRRLRTLRAAQPVGLRVGGFGWVTDLKPALKRRLVTQRAQLQSAVDAATAAVTNAKQQDDAAVAVATKTAQQAATAKAAAATANQQLAQLQQELADAQQELAAAERGDVGDVGDVGGLGGLAGRGGLGHELGPHPVPHPPIVVIERLKALVKQLTAQVATAETAATTAQHNADAAAQAAAQAVSAQSTTHAALVQAHAKLAALQAQLQDVEKQLDAVTAGQQEFIHAPSLPQAATAAVLRSGYLAHRDDAQANGQKASAPFAIDLSSARVRLAEHLLEGARSGQPPAALLGYRFERDLRDSGYSRWVLALRTLCPYGELTAAEVAVGVAQAAYDAAQLAVQQLDDAANAQQQDEQIKLAAVHNADADAIAKKAAKDAADKAVADAQAALQQAQDELGSLEDFADSTALGANIPFWKVPELPPGSAAAAARRAAEQQRAVIQQDNQALQAAQAQAAAAAAALTAAQQVQEVAHDRLTQSEADGQALEAQVTDATHQETAAQDALAAAKTKVDQLRTQLRDQAQEAVAANSVVDGLMLLRRYFAGLSSTKWDETTIPFGAQGLPAVDSPDGAAIVAALQRLADAVDAVADAVTAEAVHHLAQGNPARAAAAADALPHFDAPPELEFVRTPRSGKAFTHRLLVLAAPVAGSPRGWGDRASSPRAAAEPALDAWVAVVLPDPASVRAQVQWFDVSDGTSIGQPVEVALADLGLSPSDVVYGVAGDHGELTDRLLDHVASAGRPATGPPTVSVRVVDGRAPGWTPDVVAWRELLAMAGSLRDLISATRTADARDLVLPDEAADTGADVTELAGRADAAATALQQVRTALASAAQPTAPDADVRAALLGAASFGVLGSVPQPVSADAGVAWRAQLAAASDEVSRRVDALTAARATFDASSSNPSAQLSYHLDRLAITFGAGFRAAPRFRAANAPELEACAAADEKLTADNDPIAALTWLERVGRVRAGARRLASVMLQADALAPGPVELRVAQLPYQPGTRWLALPGATPAGGEVSLVAAVTATPNQSGELIGLVVDEWVETVPEDQVTTGVAFRYERPAARPPQTWLLATPGDQRHVWDLETLEAVVLETLDLARLRAADLDVLKAAGSAVTQYLPACYLASNPVGATVSTELA